jgi:NADPH:quinone reductase-like Zn-dependent oxidoreductase
MVAAGVVDAVGSAVSAFRLGDRLYAFTRTRFGCHAEQVCVPADGVVGPMPSNATWVEAAAVPYGGLMALHFLRRGRLRAGEQVMVYGASGAVGTAAVQLATHFGAQVTGVCGPKNGSLVRSLGADDIVDYTREDLGARGPRYDLVLDAVGKASKRKAAAAMAPRGRFTSVNHGTPRFTADQLSELTAFYEAGGLRSVIDRVYPLDGVVDAHRHVETGHKTGDVVLTLE